MIVKTKIYHLPSQSVTVCGQSSPDPRGRMEPSDHCLPVDWRIHQIFLCHHLDVGQPHILNGHSMVCEHLFSDSSEELSHSPVAGGHWSVQALEDSQYRLVNVALVKVVF